MVLLPEPWPEVPRLVALYDLENAGRWDHDFYLALAAELGAETVVDIGCGTGVFAVDIATQGHRSIGVDPAAASLDHAMARPGGDTVEWLHGGADVVPDDTAELAIMMGHVAQYFVTDEAWATLLAEAARFLRPGGRLAFETRNPVIAWSAEWTRARTETDLPHPDGGTFTSWVDVKSVDGPADSYTITHEGTTILPDGEELRTLEHLRFRNPDQVIASLADAGLTVERTWGGWERSPFDPATSREFIVQARRP